MKSKKLRDSANGEACTFQIAGVCSGYWETTSLCHIPTKDTNGMGMKVDDATSAAFGCSSCHDVVDGRIKNDEYKNNKWFYNFRALGRTQRRWIELGLMKVTGLK